MVHVKELLKCKMKSQDKGHDDGMGLLLKDKVALPVRVRDF